jgi:hypothetical protein
MTYTFSNDVVFWQKVLSKIVLLLLRLYFRNLRETSFMLLPIHLEIFSMEHISFTRSKFSSHYLLCNLEYLSAGTIEWKCVHINKAR